MEIKNFRKAAREIKKAIKKQEKFILFSDNDIDGVTSLIIIEETLKKLGGKIMARCFADTNKEIYGLSKIALRSLKKYSPGFLILMDCGMGNFQEIELAQKMGFKIIIIEHHLPLVKIPPAEIIINPQQKNDKYPFKFLATAGLCFKFSQELLKKEMSESLRREFLELAYLATIADKAPLEKDNKILTEEGLSCLRTTIRPGLKLFFEKFKKYPLEKIVQRIIWTLQITDKNYLPESYKLLTWPKGKKLKNLFDLILIKSFKRQEKIRELVFQVEKKVSPKTLFIFEGGKEFLGLTGAVASWLLSKFKIPVIIFSLYENKIKGSTRVPQGINTIDIYKKCQFYLKTYGGHAVASGFSLKKKNLEKFKKCIEKNMEHET